MISPEHLHLLVDGGKFLLGAVVGAIITKRVDGKPELVSHWGHVSAFTARSDKGDAFVIHTHEIVIQNTGRKPATNVRVSHVLLPDQFNVMPSVPYSVETLPDGKRDLVFPSMVPKQQITIAYLYNPPLTVAGINAGIRSDDGFAKPVEMELSQKYSRTFNALVGGLFLIGCGAVLYWLWKGVTLLGF